MRQVWWIGAAALLALSNLGCASGGGGARFGGDMKLKPDQAVTVADVTKDPKAYEGKWIRVKAEVTEVCENKGCWIRVADQKGGEVLFVKFTCPIEGRLVPLEAAGHKVVVEGTLKVEQLTEAQARHYAEDAGKSKAEIEKIVGPQTQLRLWDAAAEIEGVATQQPAKAT